MGEIINQLPKAQSHFFPSLVLSFVSLLSQEKQQILKFKKLTEVRSNF